MRFPEKISREEYETIAEKSLRLFLSVDIVDSTALKQELRDRESSWIEIAHTFYTRFPNLVDEALAAMQFWDRTKSGSELTAWKAIGDELVFVADIESMPDVPLLIEGFRDAVNGWNAEYESKAVSVKAVGWLAGFPVMNSVIPGDADDHFDYLGSSMDVGFRLCRFATPRKFVLAIDLAYVLAALGEELEEGLRYHGPEVLKGVLRNRPYPVFWLDCFAADTDEAVQPCFARLARLEDEITASSQPKFERRQMENFSREWIESTGGDILLPFCPDGEEDPRFPVPPEYEEKREEALAELEREFLEQGDIGRDENLDEFREDIDKL